MEFDLENPMTDFDDHNHYSVTPNLFLIEADHMPSKTYLQSIKGRDFDAFVRREVISSISQYSCKFDPFLSYLAVNYLDRFLSSQGMLEPKPWAIKLLALSCVSLAAKMKKTGLSLTLLQKDKGFIFDTKTIERMEVIILSALKWRMRSVTPFSFLPYFISLFNVEELPLKHALKAIATELIIKAQYDINLLEFKPSAIAASALLSASNELFPLQFSCFEKAISNCCVSKEYLLDCYNAMHETEKQGHESVLEAVSSTNTPGNVLDIRFSSSVSESSDKTTCSTSSTTSRLENDIKRRKIDSTNNNDYCNNQTALQS